MNWIMRWWANFSGLPLPETEDPMTFLPISPSGRRYGRFSDNPRHPARTLRALLASPSIVLPPTALELCAFKGPTRDQGQEGCHDEKTEVLTERGWTPWPEYDGHSLLGTMNPLNHNLEFQAPSALHVYDHHGPMVATNRNRLDFCVTPQHRMFVRPWNEKLRTLSPSFQMVTAEKLGWYCGLPHATSGWIGADLKRVAFGHEYDGDDFVALVSLVVSDGWVGGTDSNKNSVCFASFKPERREMVAALGKRLGFSELPGREGVWKRNDPELAEWFRRNAYTDTSYRAPSKKVPDIIKCATSQQIALFMKFYGDQHEGHVNEFYSTSQRLMGDLQELLLRVGKRGTIIPRKDQNREATMGDGRIVTQRHDAFEMIARTTDRLSIERKNDIEEVEYQGNVFCATVPNSLLVTRRNGSVLVSGNSCTGQAGAEKVDLDYRQFADWTDRSIPADQFEASASFVYKCNLIADGDLGTDAGSSLHQTAITISQRGAATNKLEPYSDTDFTTPPSSADYSDGLLYRMDAYHYLPDLLSMKSCLAPSPAGPGHSFIFGINVYDSFESDWPKPGFMPVPNLKTESLLGGHAQHVIGYDDTIEFPDGSKGGFLVQNSWGPDFGISAPSHSDGGCYWMPYAFVTGKDPDNGAFVDDAWINHHDLPWHAVN